MPDAASIRTFDGDLEALYGLIARSWDHDYRDTMRLEYSKELLRWSMGSPNGDRDLLLGAYDGGRLVGFVGRFPRNVALGGQTIRAALGTFLTTDVGHRGRGIGRRLVLESVERLRDRQYAGYFFYLQRGHASAPLYRRLRLPCDLVASGVRFFVRILDAKALAASWRMSWIERTAVGWMDGFQRPEAGAGDVRPVADSDLSACVRLLNALGGRARVARVWQEDELRWRLTGHPQSLALVLEDDGAIRGLIGAYLTEVVGSRWGTAKPRPGGGRERTGFVDMLVVDGLPGAQKQALLSASLAWMKDAGCTLALAPSLYSAGTAALLKSRFFPDVFTPAVDLRFARVREGVEPLSRGGRVCLDLL
jgi:GNAT superfamily N-acetyltransferase